MNRIFLVLTIIVILFHSCEKESENPNTTYFLTDTFTDIRDGKIYNTIKIGEQWWMSENLAYLPNVDSSKNGSSSIPYYYVHGFEGNDSIEAKRTINYLTYGVLYNWPAALLRCPEGWHNPTEKEWNELAEYISDNKGPYTNYGSHWMEVGKHLKSTKDWADNGNGSDDFGFRGLPGGFRSAAGGFYHHTKIGIWWESAIDTDTIGYTRGLYSINSNLGRASGRAYGRSIRCIKDY